MKVFLADDSAEVCARIRKLLSIVEGITVSGEAHDVQGAIDSIKRLKPNVVILDIQMPGGSGIDILREIKEEAPAPIVVMLTNYSYPQYRRKYLAAGANFFFDKSTEFSKVVDVFSQLREYQAA